MGTLGTTYFVLAVEDGWLVRGFRDAVHEVLEFVVGHGLGLLRGGNLLEEVLVEKLFNVPEVHELWKNGKDNCGFSMRIVYTLPRLAGCCQLRPRIQPSRFQQMLQLLVFVCSFCPAVSGDNLGQTCACAFMDY